MTQSNNNSLRAKLKAIKIDHTDSDPEGYNRLCDQEVDKILAAFKQAVPEKRPGAVKPGQIIPFDDDKKVEMHWLRKCQDAGFNQALTELTAIIEGEK